MVCHDLSGWGQHSCRRAVYGLCRGFRVLDQEVGQHVRRRRTHRRCIGCGENTRQGSSPRIRRQVMRRKPVSTDSKIHLLVRPDRIFSSRPCSLRPHGAQGRVKAGRRATLDASCAVSRPRLDRPSTVLRCREAVPILGMVRLSVSLSCGSGRHPHGTRRRRRLGRAALLDAR